jgi:hypothetical protein
VKARILLPIILLAGCAAPPPGVDRQGAASELVGRTAGTPKRCVTLNQLQGLRMSENNRHTLLYGSGRTIWANYVGPECGFGSNDVLVTHPLGSSLCRGDIVRSFDRYSRIPGAGCVLGDFVPYTR